MTKKLALLCFIVIHTTLSYSLFKVMATEPVKSSSDLPMTSSESSRNVFDFLRKRRKKDKNGSTRQHREYACCVCLMVTNIIAL